MRTGGWNAVVVGVAMAIGGGFAAAPPAQAQMAVIDVSAIRQLALQVRYWQDQIEAVTEQIRQLDREYDAITGTRGMELLVPITVAERNYLPTDWAALVDLVVGASAEYAVLAADVRAIVDGSAVLPEAVLAELRPTHREMLESGRNLAAMAQALSRQAYGETSLRFAQIDALRAAIRDAEDPKAIADLSARIAAEEAMLANDQLKLEALRQIADGEARMQAQRIREATVEGIGTVLELPAVEY